MARGPRWLDNPQRPCARCGELTYSAQVVPLHRRCATRSPHRPAESWSERKRRAATVDAWITEHGPVCPGWQRPPHRVDGTNPLTADHVIPYARSGTETGELSVLCRRCNSAKKDRVAPAPAPRAMPSRYTPSRDW